MATVGRQAVQTQPPRPARQGRSHFVGTMDATAIDEEDDCLTRRAEGRHALMPIVPPCVGIKRGHDFIADLGGSVLHGAHQGAQDPILEAVPGVIRPPGLPLTRCGLVHLALGQGTEGQPIARRLMPPAGPGQGKAPQDGLVFLQEDDLATLGAVCEGGECKASRHQGGGVGLQTSGGATLP